MVLKIDTENPVEWFKIEPKDAVNITLPHPGIIGPLTLEGKECPWPWEPQQLVGFPVGQFHCNYCGEMCIAGVGHTDYRGMDELYEEDMRRYAEGVPEGTPSTVEPPPAPPF